jgi:hypothetical protein
MVLDRPKHITTYEEALHTLEWNFVIHNDTFTHIFSRVRRRKNMLTSNQNIRPAQNARVCIISFSVLRPTSTTNSPDFCINKENSNNDIKTESEAGNNTTSNNSPSKTKAILRRTKLQSSSI